MKTQRRKTGFTLTEILVVIAIVGILAAILFAVMGRVRENGRSSTCQNNLKQLALAIQQYAADSDGHYPDARFQVQLSPYIKAAGWIECPTHEAYSAPKLASVDFRYFYLYGYSYNGTRLTNQSKVAGSIIFSGKNEAALPDTATTWAFSDDDPFTIGESGASGAGGMIAYDHCDTGQNFWVTMHNGGANYSFLDGHVKWFTPTAINNIYCSNQPK